MRKKFLLFFEIIIFLFGIIIVFLFEIKFLGKKREYNFIKNISEIKLMQYSYYDEDFYLSFGAGKRENPYLLNGKVEELVDYGIVSIKPLKNCSILDFKYMILCVDNQEFYVDVIKSPFNEFYVCDLRFCPEKVKDIKFYLKFKSIEKEIILKNDFLDFKINQTESMNIFLKNYSEKLKEFSNNNLSQLEFHINIIQDIKGEFDKKFWLVSAYNKKGEEYSVCIDTIDGNIVVTNFW